MEEPDFVNPPEAQRDDTWKKVAAALLLLFGKSIVSRLVGATKRQAADIVSEGIAAGETIRQIATRLDETLKIRNRVRAMQMARTQVVAASNRGSLAGALESGVVELKEWLATLDDRVRDTHAEANGQTVGVEEPFDVGGFPGMYPGDPALPIEETANCRCSLAYRKAADDRAARAIYRAIEKKRARFHGWASRVNRTALSATSTAAVLAYRSADSHEVGMATMLRAIETEGAVQFNRALTRVWGRLIPIFAEEEYQELVS